MACDTEKLVARYVQSGKTQQQFCEDEQVPVSTLQYHKEHFRSKVSGKHPGFPTPVGGYSRDYIALKPYTTYLVKGSQPPWRIGSASTIGRTKPCLISLNRSRIVFTSTACKGGKPTVQKALFLSRFLLVAPSCRLLGSIGGFAKVASSRPYRDCFAELLFDTLNYGLSFPQREQFQGQSHAASLAATMLGVLCSRSWIFVSAHRKAPFNSGSSPIATALQTARKSPSLRCTARSSGARHCCPFATVPACDRSRA